MKEGRINLQYCIMKIKIRVGVYFVIFVQKYSDSLSF